MLKQALDMVQGNLLTAWLQEGSLHWGCKSLLRLGGYPIIRRMAKPFFAVRTAMKMHMQRLSNLLREQWACRLARPQWGDRREKFLLTYLPQPLHRWGDRWEKEVGQPPPPPLLGEGRPGEARGPQA